MKKKWLAQGLAAALVFFPFGLQAALVTTLTLHQYELTVRPTESVEIWATFALDPSSDPLVFDTSSDYPWGLDPAFIPTHGNLQFPGDIGTPFASYTDLSTSGFRMCLIRIDHGCTLDEYDFNGFGNFWLSLEAGSFAPGDSFAVLLYTLIPRDGVVTAGQYTMDNMGLGFIVSGLDAESGILRAFPDVAATCPDRSPECRLRINVVPLPPTVLLFASALIVLLRRERLQVFGSVEAHAESA